MENRWKKCNFHPIQSDGNTMFHRIRHTSTTTTSAQCVYNENEKQNKNENLLEETKKNGGKYDAEQIVRQRTLLLRKASEQHRKCLFMYGQRAWASAAGFDRNLYVTRSRSKFCETKTTLSVEGYISQVSEVFGCATRGCQHQPIQRGCRLCTRLCTKWKMLVFYQCRKIFLILFFFALRVAVFALAALIWTI